MARGYMGKILFVDLSKNKLRDEALDEKLCRQFIGGYGIDARILFSRQKAGVDPLGPDNILGIFTGPFTGTPALAGTKHTMVGKSPLTGGWGDANSGRYFGAFLKYAGYDAVFFIGTWYLLRASLLVSSLLIRFPSVSLSSYGLSCLRLQIRRTPIVV